MPNWCSNIVEFKGDEKQIESLKVLFDHMALKKKKLHTASYLILLPRKKVGIFLK
jgi:hypothetical protein